MALYSANNLKLNGEKLWVMCIVIACSLVYLFSTQDLFTKFIIIIADVLTAAVLFMRYRANAFELYFNHNGIVQLYTYSGNQYFFTYLDLKQIHYRDASGSTATNTLIFQKGPAFYKVKVNTVGYNESYVSFIKWLKTKNPYFETYVYPKGSTLHMRLRQELLGTEY